MCIMTGCMQQAVMRQNCHAEPTIQVVCMWIEALSHLQAGMEPMLLVAVEAITPKVQPSRHHLDMPLAQRVVDNCLILLHHDAASGVDNVSTGGALRVNEVYGRKDEFLLELAAAPNVLLALGGLHGHKEKRQNI